MLQILYGCTKHIYNENYRNKLQSDFLSLFESLEGNKIHEAHD